jgi:membrane-associated protein
MTLAELLAWIGRYDSWVYGLLAAYAIGKTGPLPMVAGYAAAQGALRLDILLCITVLASALGAQLRFGIGHYLAPWLYRKAPRLAPWLALASAGVERYSLPVVLLYRFVKGAFSAVGIGAGASLLAWKRFALIDIAGAMVWACTIVGIGYGLGQLGAHLDPRWAAYVGLTLLVCSILFISIASTQIKSRLLPLAEKILAAKKQPAP